MKWVYSAKAEADGIGKAGKPVDPDPYLKLHGYCEPASKASGPPDPTTDPAPPVESESGAVMEAPTHGAVTRSRKV